MEYQGSVQWEIWPSDLEQPAKHAIEETEN